MSCVDERISAEEVRELLQTWARWARCRIGTEYPSVSSCYVFTSGKNDASPCNDSLAESIDRGVRQLKYFDEVGYLLIVHHYIEGISKARIAKSISRDRKYVIEYINRAESFLAGYLSYIER